MGDVHYKTGLCGIWGDLYVTEGVIYGGPNYYKLCYVRNLYIMTGRCDLWGICTIISVL